MRSSRKPNARRSAGLVFARVHHGASQAMWPAIVDEAARRDVNLFCFPGGRMGLRGAYEVSRNSVFELAAGAPLDGMLVWASTLVGPGEQGSIDSLMPRWSDIPMVGISEEIPGVPAALIDFYSGMREAVRHLIRDHGYRKVAFLRGPQFHQSAEERYRAYNDVLAEQGQPMDPALVSTPRDWTEGAEAIAELLDDRKLIPGKDFRALAIASDLMALWAVMSLQDRGYRVPEDVAVVGVNDIVESRIAAPPLTTVAAPFAELGVLALDTLLDGLEGKTVPPSRTLPARLVLRQSCGCASRSFRLAGGAGAEIGEEGESVWGIRLEAAWRGAVFRSEDEPFFATLNEAIDRSVREGAGVQPLQDAISLLRASVSGEGGISLLGDPAIRHMEDIAGQARVLLAEGAERAMNLRTWEKDRSADAIAELDHALFAALDFESLPGILVPAFGRLGIRSAYICRFEEGQPAGRPDGKSRLVFAFRDGEALDTGGLAEGAVVFPSADLLPPEFYPDRQLAYMVEPLFFHENPIGYCLLEIGPRAGVLYEEIRDAISNALRSIILFARVEREREAAQRANAIKTRLLSGISSELKDPVERILEGAGRLAAMPAEGYDPAPDIAAIRKGAEHQRRLVRDLYDLSRAEIDELAVNMEPVDTANLLRGVFADFRPVSRSEVQWTIDVLDGLPSVMADPARLRQVISSLLANAARFTARGRIHLSARLESVAPAEAQPHASRIRISVSDTGPGIAQSRLEGLFEPFVAWEGEGGAENAGGIGLGLSLAKHLVTLHLGDIEVESVPGKGSSFHVLLPVRLPSEALDEDVLPDAVSPVVCSVIEYIKKNYYGNITRWKLADTANVSEFYVSRLFRKETGLTLWEYLTRLRLGKAKELLRSGTDSIAIVGERVGFSDQAYFSRVFRKATGVSPLEYRNSRRNQSRSATTEGSSRNASPR